MLVIRTEQLQELVGARLEAFARGLARSLCSAFPSRFASHDDARSFVDRTLASAFANGIDREPSIITFARLRAAYGESFEWTPVAVPALALLHDASLPGVINVAALADCLDTATGGRPITLVDDGER